MKEPPITLKKILGHWKTVRTHRKWVRYYCRLAGIRWRGWTHDLSKYSPTEFWESVRYYQGNRSPINAAKEAKGYSNAWLHHRGRNRHHWAYWADNFSEGMIVHLMPEDDFVEMVCDFLGAGRAYSGDAFSYSGEYAWWLRERDGDCAAMHPANKRMLDIIFSDLEKAHNPMYIEANTNMIYDFIPSPEQLIKSGYLQEVYRANRSNEMV